MSSPSTINSQLSTNPALIPLHDGRRGLRRGFHAEVREPSLTQDFGLGTQDSALSPTLPIRLKTQDFSPGPVLDFIASSEALDRYNEIICADGWRLENYRRNPVFQNAHQYGDIIFTLGKALITEVRGGKLFQRVEFATDINPMAKIAYGLYKGKFLNAVSVGFIPLKWEDLPSSSSSSSTFRRKYLEQELLEVSAVGIPANPEALQLGLKAGAIQRADIRAMLDLLKSMIPKIRGSNNPTIQQFINPIPSFSGNPAAPNIDAGVSGVRSYEAQLLQLARALRDLLRR